MLWFMLDYIAVVSFQTPYIPQNDDVYCHTQKGISSPAVKHPSDHDDVIKWKHFPRHWPFLRGIHRSPVNSPHKGQWSGAFMFSLICALINGWVNNGEAGVMRRYRAHYDVIVMHFICCHGGAMRNSIRPWKTPSPTPMYTWYLVVMCFLKTMHIP